MRGKLFVALGIFATSLTLVAAEDSYWLEIDVSDDSTFLSSHLHTLVIKDFESLAAETDYINHGALLYNRSVRRRDDSFSRCLEQIEKLSRIAGFELLKEAIAHEDPRVRTLGLYAILAKGNPKLLPLVFSAIQDTEQTFPQEVMWSSSGLNPTENRVRVKNSAVREHAAAIIKFYAVDTYAFDNEGNINPLFVEQWNTYWELRKDRDHCAGWMRVGFKRATGGISPLPSQRIQRVETLKYRGIWRLPSPERQMTLLWLAAEGRLHPDQRVLQEHSDLRTLASDFDLREACQQLGPDRLMQILRFKPLTDDPDLQPNDRSYHQIVRWILITAKDVLPPEFAPELVALGLAQRDKGDGGYLSPWWFIAAAQLQPEKAGEYLDLAWPLFDRRYQAGERAWLMWARWKILGLEEYSDIAVWFYSDKEQPGAIGGGYHRFVNMLRGSAASTLLAKLALEDGFLELNSCDLGYFALAVSRFAFKPPVDPQDYTDLGRPNYPSIEDAQNAIRTWAKEVLSPEGSERDATPIADKPRR